ncbi:MAG: hypothetical protein RLZZ488_1481 [Pseudomonadota bacterium]|jgi:hypothetical protein
MIKRLSAVKLSFLISAAVHLAAWRLLPAPAGEVRLAGAQSQQKVYLVDAPVFRNESPVRKDASISKQPKRKSKDPKEIIDSQAGIYETSDGSSTMQEPERETWPTSRIPLPHSESALEAQDSSHDSPSEHGAAFSEWFSQVAHRCNNIQLPRHWLNLRDFWPRRYEVGFVFERNEGEDRLKLQRMRAVAGEMPALDGRIRNLLADCLQKFGHGSLVAEDSSVLALNRDSGEAYSVTLEFTDGSYRIVSPRGF